MTKNTMIFKADRTNVASLIFQAGEDDYKSNMEVVHSAVRFVHSAAALSRGTFLGIEISADKDGRINTCVFSSPKTRVTGNDYTWIFEGLAKVSYREKETWRPSFEGMRSYAVHYRRELKVEKSEEAEAKSFNVYAANMSYIAGRISTYEDVKNMLVESGAIMQIFVGGAQNETPIYSHVFFHFPAKISLKERTKISMIFPGATLEEINKDSINSTYRIPAGHIMEQIQRFFHSFRPLKDLNNVHESPHESMIEDDDEPDEDMEEPDFVDEDDVENEDGFFEVPTQKVLFDASKVPEADKPFPSLETTKDLDYIYGKTYKCLKKAGIFYVDQIRNKTDEQLLKIEGINQESLKTIKHSVKVLDQGGPTCPIPLTHMGMLNDLIGLKGVKEQMQKIAAFAKMKRDMPVARNLQMSLNMAFVGNPGTAKTTVARLFAGILFENGLLKSKDIVEVGRADLIAKYEGQTADRVKAIFLKAKGRLLFIDEAYSLLEDIGEFGAEAINTIVQEMENRRNETVVVFAGYPNEMEAFISRNPGLRSRIPFKVTFEDYSAEELYSITELETAKRGFTISPDAVETLKEVLQVAVGNPKAGNGRFCRNAVEKAILNYSHRIYGDREKKKENDYTLMAEDFEKEEGLVERIQEEKPRLIGFRAPTSEEDI